MTGQTLTRGLVCAFATLVLAGRAHATLVPTLLVDAPMTYQVELLWTAGGNPVAETFNCMSCSFWRVEVLTSQLGGTVIATAVHLVDPHPGEPVPGPTLMTTALPVTPGLDGSGSDSAAHGSHEDLATLTITSLAAGSSTIVITATHQEPSEGVPEPGTLLLSAVGALGVTASRWYRCFTGGRGSRPSSAPSPSIPSH